MRLFPTAKPSLPHKKFAVAGGAHRLLRARLQKSSIEMQDGCSLSAIYGEPKRRTNNSFKFVIFVHGFAAEKTENGLFSEAAKRLVSHGYTILAYDWRGVGRSTGDFANSSLDLHVQDFREVVKIIQSQKEIAESEICIVAFSLGAAIVSKAIHLGTKVGTVVYWSPATRPSLHMWPRYSSHEIRKRLDLEGFILKADNKVKLGKGILESLRDTDLGENAFDLSLPLLVCHGTNDVRIPLEGSRFSYQAAIGNGVKCISFAEFDGASHSFRPEKHYRKQLIELLWIWLEYPEFRGSNARMRVVSQAGPESPERASSSDPAHAEALQYNQALTGTTR